MGQTRLNHTTVYPASQRDLVAVDRFIKATHAQTGGGNIDTGLALLKALGAAPASPLFTSGQYASSPVLTEWIKTPGSKNNGVILYLHGRRFQHDEPAELFAPRLSQAARVQVVIAHYRLAPEFPYPASLHDVIGVYEMLLSGGFAPSDIVIIGHSSGATLALSALLQLKTLHMPMPAGAVALSAITDFTFTGGTMSSNLGRDIITTEEAFQVRSAYLADAPADKAPQSPLFGDLTGLSPVLLISGGAELFLDDVHRFADRARAANVDVSLGVFDGMPHAFCLLPLDAADAVLGRIGTFVDQKMNARSV